MQWKNPAACGQSHFADATLLPFFITNENVGPSPRSDCRAVRDLRATSVSNSGNLMPPDDFSAHIPGFKCRVALLHRTRRRWPNAPFRWITVCPGFKRNVVIVVRDLSAVK
jgi:hypothetical protein